MNFRLLFISRSSKTQPVNLLELEFSYFSRSPLENPVVCGTLSKVCSCVCMHCTIEKSAYLLRIPSFKQINMLRHNSPFKLDKSHNCNYRKLQLPHPQTEIDTEHRNTEPSAQAHHRPKSQRPSHAGNRYEVARRWLSRMHIAAPNDELSRSVSGDVLMSARNDQTWTCHSSMR
jgi:hypothetical protein